MTEKCDLNEIENVYDPIRNVEMIHVKLDGEERAERRIENPKNYLPTSVSRQR
jgi:hypothetical protein